MFLDIPRRPTPRYAQQPPLHPDGPVQLPLLSVSTTIVPTIAQGGLPNDKEGANHGRLSSTLSATALSPAQAPTAIPTGTTTSTSAASHARPGRAQREMSIRPSARPTGTSIAGCAPRLHRRSHPRHRHRRPLPARADTQAACRQALELVWKLLAVPADRCRAPSCSSSGPSTSSCTGTSRSPTSGAASAAESSR